jgi:DNA-binding HxlR family transcriptional regulator
MAKRLPKNFNCPTEFTLAVLGGKWKTVILCYLGQRPCRYSELRAFIPDLSDKMLTERLRDLIAAGLVAQKKRTDGASSAVYLLTSKGKSLRDVLVQLYSWGRQHADAFNVKVGEPMKKIRARAER